MNTRVGISIVILLVVLGVAAALLTPAKQQMLNLFSSQQISVSTSTITASTTEYTVDASYPQFGIPAIDSQIKSVVEDGVNGLSAQATMDKPAENGYPTYAFTASFSDAYIGSDYISVPIVLADYTGGAHELPTIIGATYDRSTGEAVTLDDALMLTGMSLPQVATEAKKQLAENPETAPTGIWAAGSDPIPDNYSTFLINADSVTFIFQPYQVAPYSSGAPEVSIPRIK